MYQAKQLPLQMLDVVIFVTLVSYNFSVNKIHSERIKNCISINPSLCFS